MYFVMQFILKNFLRNVMWYLSAHVSEDDSYLTLVPLTHRFIGILHGALLSNRKRVIGST